MTLVLRKFEEFWIVAVVLLVAWLLAAHQSTRSVAFGLAGSYLYWACRILIEAAFFVAVLLAVERYFKSLLSQWMRYLLAIVLSLIPFTLAITAMDLIVGLPELGLNGDTQVPASRGWAFAMEIAYQLDNHIALSALLLLPRLLAQMQDQSKTDNAPESLAESSHNNTNVTDIPLSFFASLQPPLDGNICCMEAQEHYILVTTTTESRMVLHRFSDAVRQTPAALGMQVHRSYWIAHAQVQGVVVEGQSMKLKLAGNKIVPVSRTYRAAVERRYSGG